MKDKEDTSACWRFFICCSLVLTIHLRFSRKERTRMPAHGTARARQIHNNQRRTHQSKIQIWLRYVGDCYPTN